MKILVTGGAGFIGTNLCLLLAKNGYDPIALDSFDDYYAVGLKKRNADELSKKSIEVAELDLAESELAGVLQNVSYVIHLAGQPGLSASTSWNTYFRNNLLATHRLVEAVKNSGSGAKVVCVSSSSCYGAHASDAEDAILKPTSWYGTTKLAGEMEVLAAHRRGDISASVVRPFSVYGERERPDKLFPKLVDSIAKGNAFPLFEGSSEHRRAFTYVGDICEGIIACIQNWDKAEGEIFNLGTEESFTTGEAIRLVENLMGKEAILEILPPRDGDQIATNANIKKARTILGWSPKTSLEEGLGNLINWYRNIQDS